MKTVWSYLGFIYQKMSVFKKHSPVTYEYPFSNKYIPLFSRLRIMNNFSECTGCKKCEEVCPMNAIQIQGEAISHNIKKPKTKSGNDVVFDIRSFELDYSSCIFCGICINDCPTGSLVNEKQFVEAVDEIRNLKVDLKTKDRPNLKGLQQR